MQPVEVRIQWLDGRGHGGARLPKPHRGVVAVPKALPGDVVRIHLPEDAPSFATVEMVDLVEPSTFRRDPTCPHHTQCGGCPLGELDPDERRRQLATNVARQLGINELPTVAHTTEASGRARIDLTVHVGRIGYRASKTHDLVPIDTCEIAEPAVQDMLARVLALSTRVDMSDLQRLAIRTDGTKTMVSARSARSTASPALREALTELEHVALDGKALHGDPTLWLQVHGLRLRCSPQSFFQVNRALNELLVADVVARVQAARPEAVIDLYSGLGNLTLPIAAACGAPVTGVDREGQAIQDLRFNARALGLPLVNAISADVRKLDLRTHAFDVAVVDPGRAGCGDALGRVMTQRPRRIVYVSCHLPSAVRELKQVRSHGYRLRDVRCYDLFPSTSHVETVFTLDRDSDSLPLR